VIVAPPIVPIPVPDSVPKPEPEAGPEPEPELGPGPTVAPVLEPSPALELLEESLVDAAGKSGMAKIVALITVAVASVIAVSAVVLSLSEYWTR